MVPVCLAAKHILFTSSKVIILTGVEPMNPRWNERTRAA
jgi:hypothetical protein